MNRSLSRSIFASVGALGVLLAAGCAPSFEPASKIKTLRVLAVEKDKPYARPGETVKLRMLLADGAKPEKGEDARAPRPVQVLWLAGCINPLGDLYAGCFADLAEGSSAPQLSVGQGLAFDFTLPKDIISSRPAPADRKQTPYGLSYVFFAACAGEVRFEPPAKGANTNEFPLACYSSEGKRLGPSDFVAGYTAIFAYDHLTNANPVLKKFQFDDRDVEPECVDAECIALEGEGPTPNDAGAPSPGAPEGGATPDAGSGAPAAPSDLCATKSPLCISVCPQEGDCTNHHISLGVDPRSVEVDEAAAKRQGGEPTEQMWLNYYASDGVELGTAVKLLNDPTTGFNEDHATTLKAPKEAGEFHVWAVAHDSRGGTSWARLKLAAH